MIERRSGGRLRSVGAVGALAIVGVLIVQVVVLIVLTDYDAAPVAIGEHASVLRRADYLAHPL